MRFDADGLDAESPFQQIRRQTEYLDLLQFIEKLCFGHVCQRKTMPDHGQPLVVWLRVADDRVLGVSQGQGLCDSSDSDI